MKHLHERIKHYQRLLADAQQENDGLRQRLEAGGPAAIAAAQLEQIARLTEGVANADRRGETYLACFQREQARVERERIIVMHAWARVQEMRQEVATYRGAVTMKDYPRDWPAFERLLREIKCDLEPEAVAYRYVASGVRGEGNRPLKGLRYARWVRVDGKDGPVRTALKDLCYAIKTEVLESWRGARAAVGAGVAAPLAAGARKLLPAPVPAAYWEVYRPRRALSHLYDKLASRRYTYDLPRRPSITWPSYNAVTQRGELVHVNEWVERQEEESLEAKLRRMSFWSRKKAKREAKYWVWRCEVGKLEQQKAYAGLEPERTRLSWG
jgi:hypothetical protein